MGSITGIWIAGLALLITFTQLVGLSLYKIGHLSARIEELEKWRVNIRNDLHEISDRMEHMALAIEGLKTIIEERTDRRKVMREAP